MAVTICPTILATDAEEYQRQVERVTPFAARIHIDIADGTFAPVETVPMDEIWWPGGVRADVHVMYEQPFEHAKLLLDLRPQLIVVHAEAKGDFVSFAKQAHKNGVEVGVALLPKTSPEVLRPALALIDHVLVFSGNLGHFGGQADLRLLPKVKHLLKMKPQLELGWDGGVNDKNARALAMSGIQVLNAGGSIQKANDPKAAFQALAQQAASF